MYTDGAAGRTFTPSASVMAKDMVLKKGKLLPGVQAAEFVTGHAVAVYW